MKPKTIIILIIVILSFIVIIQNTEIVSLQLFFWKLSMSRVIFMVILIFIGSVLGFIVSRMLRKY
ncbi:MAG: LapA family protein [Candidatus Aminicenantaceae bacterium]